jgi:shikimate dehydrogenase
VITGATRVAGVIGDPVRHSLSPRLHNAAYRALGLDWVYVAFEVPDGGARAAIAAARALDLVGLSVTMPHKTAVAELCDELSPDAAALRSVNTVTRRAHGGFAGDSTDGGGFLRSLADAGVDPAGREVLLLGAGGAARAVAYALGGCGARVVVAARNPAAAAESAALAGGRAVPWDARDATATGSDIVVNATPIGMTGPRGESGEPPVELPLDAERLGPNQVLVDLVYHPIETALMRGARGRGATVVSGLGMLVHQAALQVERWSGQAAPLAAMRAAVDPSAGDEVDGRAEA